MSKFTAFTVYMKYIAIKQHFDNRSNYDFFKYNGKVNNIKEETFRRRKDSKMFYKLSTEYHSHHFPYVFIAAFSIYNNPWIGDIVGSTFEREYADWNNRIEYLEAHFNYQFNRLIEKSKENNDFNELFRPKTQAIPKIFEYFEDEWISLETLIIADHFTRIFETTNWFNQETIQYTHIPELEYKCNQYKKFIDIDFAKYGETIKEQLKQAKEEELC